MRLQNGGALGGLLGALFLLSMRSGVVAQETAPLFPAPAHLAKLLTPQAVDEPAKGDGGANSSKEKENRQDKGKENGDDKGKDKKEEMQKILQLVAAGKMTVEEAQAKLAEKPEEKKEDKRKLLPEGWNFHAQTTIISSFQPGFGALYSGPNSLGTNRDRRGTITADLYLGVPLWDGAELHADLLMWQGFGLSNSFGLEAFPNSDAYKAGTVDPRFMLSHFFVRQTFGLGGEQEDVPDGPFTLAGKRDVSRLTLTVGRLNMAELFDYNTYNHDPHTQFMNWASSMLTWDYPADTVGFTTGIAFELNQPDWAVRYGWFQLPSHPNGFTSDDRIFMWPVEPGEITSDGEFWKQWGMMLELERRWRVEDHPGAIRLQAWLDHGFLASYNAATALLLASPPPPNTPAGAGNNRSSGRFRLPLQIRFWGEWGTGDCEERRPVRAVWLARWPYCGGDVHRR